MCFSQFSFELCLVFSLIVLTELQSLYSELTVSMVKGVYKIYFAFVRHKVICLIYMNCCSLNLV